VKEQIAANSPVALLSDVVPEHIMETTVDTMPWSTFYNYVYRKLVAEGGARGRYSSPASTLPASLIDAHFARERERETLSRV